MLYFTSIWRLPDGWPLSATTEVDTIPEQDKWRKRSQALVKQICQAGHVRDLPRQLTVEHNESVYCYHLLNADGVLYLTFCQKGDSVAASFSFLEEISREFMSQYASRIADETRPYKFIQFDKFIGKSRKVYQSPQYSRAAPPGVERRSYNSIMGIADAPKQADNTGVMIAIGVGGFLVLLLLYYLIMAML